MTAKVEYAGGKSASLQKVSARSGIFRYIKKHFWLYMFLLPGFLFLLIFKFTPMYFIIIAFKDFSFSGDNIFQSIQNSPWVGLDYFEKMFSDRDFYQVLKNTLIINFYKLAVEIPFPVLLAIMFNEIRQKYFKRIVQTLVYIPYFINWIIIFGIFYVILGGEGIVNTLIKSMGGEPIFFFIDPRWFRTVLVVSNLWWYAGWGTVIYLAALTGIDIELYEAAIVDGANKFKQIIYITIPGLLPTIVLVIVIRMGYILTGSFDQVLTFYNPNVYKVADIIGTYVYRMGLGQFEFSYSTAVGLFNSAVGIALVFLANTLSRKLLNRSIW